ncbi:MAG: DUF3095 family protein, partial [Paracoccaceae bacterium]
MTKGILSRFRGKAWRWRFIQLDAPRCPPKFTAMQGDPDFYARLEPFRTFEGFAAFEAYAPVPDDWVVLAGDVVGSTKAIAEGRYKAVNMVGAA